MWFLVCIEMMHRILLSSIFYKNLYLIDLFQKRQTPKIIPLLLILLIFWHTTGIISRQVEIVGHNTEYLYIVQWRPEDSTRPRLSVDLICYMSRAHIWVLDQTDFIAEADLTNVLHFEKWHGATLTNHFRGDPLAVLSVNCLWMLLLSISKFLDTANSCQQNLLDWTDNRGKKWGDIDEELSLMW